jgi:hypothetical protein
VAEPAVAGTVTLVGPLEVRVKSMPVPVRTAAWVAEGALSVKVRVPESGPAAVGAKRIATVQAALAASEAVQVLEAMVKPGLAAMEEMVSGRPPLLVRVRAWVGVVRPTPVGLKVREAGLSETPGGAMPMPERATVWERNWSEIVSVAERVPEAVGAKVTMKAQVELAARELPQLLVTAKSPGETLAAMRVRATPPELVRVTLWAGLMVPMVC